jgi:uncharacterized small protein (TIGR04563 family)
MSDEKKTDRRKQSLYFPETLLKDIAEQAARLDRSVSWVVQRAYLLSKDKIVAMPGVEDPTSIGGE